jgi:hypothetical protein
LLLCFGQIAEFQVSFAEKTVTLVASDPKADETTIEHLVNDHVAPRVIAHIDKLVLHGSAVAIDGNLAIFLGDTGAGKSTLAASLHTHGHRLLGDDAVVITETDGFFCGEAVYPSLRLYPESIQQVFADPIATSIMAHYSEKRHVDAFATLARGADRVPLCAIFVLTNGDSGVKVHPLLPADACMAIVEHSFALNSDDPVAAGERLAEAARVAAAVPCFTLSYPYDFSILKSVRQTIVACMEDRQPSAPGISWIEGID